MRNIAIDTGAAGAFHASARARAFSRAHMRASSLCRRLRFHRRRGRRYCRHRHHGHHHHLVIVDIIAIAITVIVIISLSSSPSPSSRSSTRREFTTGRRRRAAVAVVISLLIEAEYPPGPLSSSITKISITFSLSITKAWSMASSLIHSESIQGSCVRVALDGKSLTALF